MKNSIFLPGEYITEAEGYIKGHGTEVIEGRIYSSYFGKVNQINKLITVEPINHFRYSPEIGDVVIGRVTQIFNKKWKLETNSKSDTTLGLSAINLPGIMQRRKSEDDEINMAKFFDIDDLVVCEVQKVNKNGTAALHTRNDKYGKLSNGILCYAYPSRISPLKSRFLNRDNIEIIVGSNGYIWISSKLDSVLVFNKISNIKNKIEELNDSKLPIDFEAILYETCTTD